MTIEDLSKKLGMSWHTIKQIDKEQLGKKYKHLPIKGVRQIAIDEFAVEKGHKYMTVVMDLETRRVIYIGEGRGSDALDGFWKKIQKFKNQIVGVAMDMWPAYIKAVSKHLPKAKIIFDWFHVIKNTNQIIDDLRRQIIQEEKNMDIRKVLKGKRWVLLKSKSNLSSREESELKDALKLNEPLMKIYYLKDELYQVWSCKNKVAAENYLNKWVKKAQNSGVTKIIKLANMVGSHRTGILNWFDYQISTGPLEGLNNKIKVLKRRAYGYRDKEYFKLKIYDIHESRYA